MVASLLAQKHARFKLKLFEIRLGPNLKYMQFASVGIKGSVILQGQPFTHTVFPPKKILRMHLRT